jgi:hypothetical protein
VTRIEDLLRDELGRADAPASRPDAMLARVARARRRRTAGAAAGGGALLASLAVGAYAALPAMLPSTGTGPAPAGGEVPARVYSDELINTIFTDQRHGYSVQQSCAMDQITEVPVGAPTPDVHRQCTSVLVATGDGGRTWTQRGLPAEPATKDTGVEVQETHSLMFWVDEDGELALGGWNQRYWTTADGGLHWQESPTRRDTGPAGSLATFDAHDRLTFLATPPPGGLPAKDERHIVVPATDGSFWTACATGGCVHVTRDRGATWQELSIVDPGTRVDWLDWVATYDGRTVYAALRINGSSRLFCSTDGGSTWSAVLDLAKPSAAGLVLPGGDLLTVESSDQGTVYRLKAGSSTLDKPAGVPAHGYALYVTGGVAVLAHGWDQRDEPDLGSVATVSTDGGATWTAVPPPTG